MHDSGGRRTFAADVTEHDLAAGDDSVLHGIEVHRRRPLDAAAAPGSGVVNDGCRRGLGTLAERLGQGPHQLAQRRTQLGSRRPRTRK